MCRVYRHKRSPEEYGSPFTDISKRIFLKETFSNLVQISPKFPTEGTIYNNLAFFKLLT